MRKGNCYLYDHEWIFICHVENADGSKYTLSRCSKCGAEFRSYDNGYIEQIYSNGLKVATPLTGTT